MTCCYFRDSAGQACYGAARDGVGRCQEPQRGELVVDDRGREERFPVCGEHWEMRAGNLAVNARLVEGTGLGRSILSRVREAVQAYSPLEEPECTCGTRMYHGAAQWVTDPRCPLHGKRGHLRGV